ncbi:uncharacterized protein UV8b_05273 [Ustilaginoidea virens]|uniref:Core domain-containing protein n=1 Tax=Ustilaginoidea virens TaxID=1159556 RepID=A0A8E5MIH3_USTVR|nr:uncharacterized protein UV8b_05273 [Ustilaginoidea virens]QUC21032.1 hypothetical protein UV8b_05273 [Ustilaginoidea virens]
MADISCATGASAARLFIHLAKRGYSSDSSAAAGRSFAPLEFLLPRRRSITRRHLACLLRPSQHYPTGKASLDKASVKSTFEQPWRRTFTVTTRRPTTTCILNPRTDEDGQEMTMEITPRAAKRLSDIMNKDKNPNLALRIQVESGGCHGFQYLMSLVTIPPKDKEDWSCAVNKDDTIFQFSPDGEPASPAAEGAKVILDEPSLELLKGSKVDFTMELIGSQFKIVDNPYAKSSCGCGTSFDVKM